MNEALNQQIQSMSVDHSYPLAGSLSDLFQRSVCICVTSWRPWITCTPAEFAAQQRRQEDGSDVSVIRSVQSGLNRSIHVFRRRVHSWNIDRMIPNKGASSVTAVVSQMLKLKS